MNTFKFLFFISAMVIVSSCSSNRSPTYHAKTSKRYHHTTHTKCGTKEAANKHKYYNSIQHH